MHYGHGRNVRETNTAYTAANQKPDLTSNCLVKNELENNCIRFLLISDRGIQLKKLRIK